MKFIHTADWHIGQDFYHYDRKDEHQHFFDQLAELVEREQPDALLVSGDIYHTSTPSNASVKLYTENMVRLHRKCPTMRIIVTAGNHDSCARLESTSELWKEANLDVIGSIDYDADKDSYDLDHNIFEIEGKGFVIAIPFIYERHYPVFTRMLDEVARRNTQNLPVVVMGHLAVLGCDLSGHDPSLIGGMETHPIDIFGDNYDYLALGHIHGPQTLPSATGTARYSGSVLHVSFDENYPHTVSVVQVEKHGDEPLVREERIKQSLHTYTVPKEALPFEEALEELRRFKPEGPGYVRLHVLVKDYAPANAEKRIRDILEGRSELKFCYIKTEYKKISSTKERLKLDVVQLKEINPLEVAKSAYEAKYRVEMDAEKVEMMQQVINEVNQQQ